MPLPTPLPARCRVRSLYCSAAQRAQLDGAVAPGTVAPPAPTRSTPSPAAARPVPSVPTRLPQRRHARAAQTLKLLASLIPVHFVPAVRDDMEEWGGCRADDAAVLSVLPSEATLRGKLHSLAAELTADPLVLGLVPPCCCHDRLCHDACGTMPRLGERKATARRWRHGTSGGSLPRALSRRT